MKQIKKSRKVACDEEVKQIKKSRKVACDEEVKQIKKSRKVACDEEVKQIKKSRKVACDEEVKQIKKSRKVACDEEVKQIKKSRKVACDEEVKQIKKSRKVRTQGLSNLHLQWLEVGNVIMYEEHRCILESDKKWLDDAIINAVQYLLHSQYGMPGFQAAILGYHLTFDIMRKGFIQILHNGEDHWFTISTLGLPSGHVHIYDSLYNTCTDHGIEQICSILYAPNNAVHLHFMDVDKQTNHSDCGLYVCHCVCY